MRESKISDTVSLPGSVTWRVSDPILKPVVPFSVFFLFFFYDSLSLPGYWVVLLLNALLSIQAAAFHTSVLSFVI